MKQLVQYTGDHYESVPAILVEWVGRLGSRSVIEKALSPGTLFDQLVRDGVGGETFQFRPDPVESASDFLLGQVFGESGKGKPGRITKTINQVQFPRPFSQVLGGEVVIQNGSGQHGMFEHETAEIFKGRTEFFGFVTG